MDEIRKLENEIYGLQTELERQKSEAAKMRQSLANENLRRLQEYEEQLRTSLDLHDREVQREYERRLKEYQRSAEEELEDSQLKMDIAYQRLLLNIGQKEKEWSEKTGRLEQLISSLRADTRNKEEVSSREVERYMTEVSLKYEDIDQKPHEKFFPKRIKAFHTAICEARQLCRNGLNEAAIAIAISARSGLSRLGFDIDEQYEEWSRQYELFQDRVGLMQIRLLDELAEWHSFAQEMPVSLEKLSDAQKEEAGKNIDYWTRGLYGDIRRIIEDLAREIETVEREGALRYLKGEESMSIDRLRENTALVEKLGGQWDRASGLYKERYNASCQRVNWGELMIDFMEDELNLDWIEEESHFRNVSAEAGESTAYAAYMTYKYGSDYDRVDTREWLELVFENSMDTRIFIYILPHEEEKLIENRLVVYVDYAGAASEEYSRQIYRHVCESIQLEDGDGIIDFVTDAEYLRTNSNAALRAAGKSIVEKLKKA